MDVWVNPVVPSGGESGVELQQFVRPLALTETLEAPVTSTLGGKVPPPPGKLGTRVAPAAKMFAVPGTETVWSSPGLAGKPPMR